MKLNTRRIFLPPIVFAILIAIGMMIAKSELAHAQDKPSIARRENFKIAGHNAFIIHPPIARKDGLKPWVWYAPTLGRGLPGSAEKWMFDRLHAQGISIAGIDVGESYGSPRGRALYQNLYEELVDKQNFHSKPVLLARSRGGLMLYSWAVEHPKKVGGIAGIYPVCNIASYPGINRAAGAFEMTPEQLKEKLAEHNPIDRLKALAKAKVPIRHIHGDKDGTVPLELNSGELAKRYKALGGPVTIEVVKGQGHNMWEGWFHSSKLTDFIMEHAIEKSKKP
jgi:pimeloyl-ACP methyl ester carboxylesterase